MTVVDLLLELSGRGVRLWTEGERLRFRAPAGVLTAADRELLVEFKAELLPLLNLAQIGAATWHPATYGQEALFYLQRLNPANVQYNLFQAVEISGPLAMTFFEKALALVVQRHSALRTIFVASPAGPLQVVPDSAAPVMELIDLSQLSKAERQAEVETTLERHARRTFNLEMEPPLAPLMLRLDEERHLFLLTIHHIVFDGWSSRLLRLELVANYKLLLEKEEPTRATRPLQYSDFARWQRRDSNGGYTNEKIDYWRQKLAGLTPLALPGEKSRPSIPSGQTGRHTFEVSAELVQKLEALGQEEEATLFMVLLATFKILLHRYTGLTDLAIGVPIAGRGRKEFEDVIGYFVNLLVMRCDFSGRPSFRNALRRVRETALDAYRHQEVPYAKLVQELRPKRDLGYNHLVHMIMTFNKNRQELPETTGLILRSLEFRDQEATFDLDLFLNHSPSGLSGVINYNLDLFEAGAIERLAGHFNRLLESIAATPNMSIGRLPMLRENERKRSIVEWNQTEAEYPRDICIHQLIERQVAKQPEAVAVCFEDRKLSYRQLNEQANQVARALTERGVRNGSLVGIFMARSEEMVVALLASHKAGAAYLPLDPTYPSSRLAFMVGDASPRVIVTDGTSLPFEHNGAVLDLSDESAFKEIPATNLDNDIDSKSLAYIIYTSGSTGKPKGVQVTHQNLANLFTSFSRRPGILPTDTMLALSSLSFDMSPLEIFLPLTCGAKVLVISREVATNGSLLLDIVEDNSVTIIQATPSTLRMLIESGWKRGGPRQIWCGGEAWTWDLAKALLERCPAVWNLYGATEMTIYSTHQRLQRGDERILVGRPIANTQIYVLDEYMEPVPAGVVGEIFLGGDGVSEGYLKRPALTAEQFVPHPFSTEPGARVYKTGDLGQTLPDGSIEFVGRRDGQVKIRGFRIELGEIETRLRQHKSVRDAVVVAHEVASNDQRLVAYVVPESGQKISSSDLTRFLMRHLPDYMSPALFIPLDSLPLSGSLKVDRLALPTPEWDREQLGHEFIAPRNPLEEKVAQAWTEILGIELIGVRDNFFDLGGHSLLAVRLMALIERQFNMRLPLSVYLEEATVEHMARALEPSHLMQRREAVIPLAQGGEDQPLFVVTAGYGDLLALSQMAAKLEPARPVYGLQPPGAAGEPPPRRDMETLATIYSQVIGQTQPQGTLQLAGYCSGGLVAFEVARRLIFEGREVSSLLLMETPFAYSHSFHTLFGSFSSLIGRVLPQEENSKWRLLKILRALFADDGLAAHLEALAGYKAVDYDGSLTLVQARWSHIRFAASKSKWDSVTMGNVERVIVPGDHDNFLRGRRVTGLAGILSEILRS